MAYALISRPKETKREEVIQIFVGHHGKTKLDGVAFGNAGIGGAMKALKKQARLLTTAQLRDYCEQWKAEQQSKLSQKKRDLNRWVFLLWEPTRFPTHTWRFHQKALLKNTCWQSVPKPGFTGSLPLHLYSHALIESNADRMEMKLNVDFTVKKCKPGGNRVEWTKSAQVVESTPEIDVQVLEHTREHHVEHKNASSFHNAPSSSHLTLQKPKKKQGLLKRKAGSCTGQVSIAISEETIGVTGGATMIEMQQECERHLLPMAPRLS